MHGHEARQLQLYFAGYGNSLLESRRDGLGQIVWGVQGLGLLPFDSRESAQLGKLRLQMVFGRVAAISHQLHRPSRPLRHLLLEDALLRKDHDHWDRFRKSIRGSQCARPCRPGQSGIPCEVISESAHLPCNVRAATCNTILILRGQRPVFAMQVLWF